MASSQQPAVPVSPGEQVTLDLAYAYIQLHRQTAVNLEEPPILTLPRHATRMEVSRRIADGLAAQGDVTMVWLRTKEERERSRQRVRKLPLISPQELQAPLLPRANVLQENMSPLICDPDVPALTVPRISSQSRTKARQQFEEFRQGGNIADEPYHIIRWPHIFKTRLASVNASMELALIDAEDDMPSATLHNVPCLWDTGAQITVVTDDILPPEFLHHLKSNEYLDQYRLGSDSATVQISMMLRFSNTTRDFDIIASVVPAVRLPNGLSGVLLGQHTLIDSLDCKLTPARILRARGISVPDGHWGRIELTGCIVDGEYESL